MFPKHAQDRAHTAFINKRVAFHDSLRFSADNICLVLEFCAWIRDEPRKKQGVCRAAFVANDPADTQFHQHTILLDGSGIAAKESHPCRFVTTWANKLVDLEGGNDTVINFLGNRIATINKNGYHKYKRMGQFCCFQVVECSSPSWVVTAGSQTLGWVAPAVFLTVTNQS